MGQQWRLPLLLTAGLLGAGLWLLLADSSVATRRSITVARSLLRGANILEARDEDAQLHTERQQQQQRSGSGTLPQTAAPAAQAVVNRSAGPGSSAAPQRQQQQQQQQGKQQQTQKQKPPKQQRCAVYNGVRFHLDVTAGLAWAFQEAGCKTDVYLHNFRLGLEDVMGPWFRGRVLNKDAMEANMGQYDLVVMATYPELASMLEAQHSLILQRRPAQRILLTVHNPRYLLESAGALAPLLLLAQHAAGGEAEGSKQQAVPPVQLLTISPCSASYTSTLLGTWAADMARWMPGWEAPSGKAAKPEVPWIVPLVPWAPANETKGGKGLASRGEGEYRGPLAHFCIQGNIDPDRRDYDAAFKAAMHPAVLSQLRRRGEQFLLVGAQVRNTQELEVPPQLRDRVQMLTDLNYQQYYDTLSRCRAILTAFGSDFYLVNKSSSSMAAALLVGTPLITEDRVLGAYQYVPDDAAFIYRQLYGETWPDPVALARTEGIRQSRLLHKLVMAGRPAAAGRRRLIEGPAALAAAGQRLADLAAEDGWEEDYGPGMPAEDQEDPVLHGSSTSSSTGNSSRDPSSSQQPPRRRLAATEQPAGKPKPGKKGGPSDSDKPPAGSYAAALLQALDNDASRAAHTAAWRAKRAAMQRNVETAQQVLRETAAWAAAAAGADT